MTPDPQNTNATEYCPQCGKVKSIRYGTAFSDTTTNVASGVYDWCNCPLAPTPFYVGDMLNPPPLTYQPPLSGVAYTSISPSDLEKIRMMVREELDKALREIVTHLRMNGATQ